MQTHPRGKYHHNIRDVFYEIYILLLIAFKSIFAYTYHFLGALKIQRNLFKFISKLLNVMTCLVLILEEYFAPEILYINIGVLVFFLLTSLFSLIRNGSDGAREIKRKKD